MPWKTIRYYNSFGRTYLFDVDFYHLKKDEDDPPKYCIDAYHAGNVSLRSHIDETVRSFPIVVHAVLGMGPSESTIEKVTYI